MAQDLGGSAQAASGNRGWSDRINPDSIVTLWFTVGLVCFLAVASFMVSFTGLHEVAAWAGLPEWLRWAVPVFIDVAILAYTMAVLIHRHRGEGTWASWVSLAGFTLFSVVANGAHALSIDHPDEVQRIIGAAVAALAPVAVFAATEQLGRLVIRRPEHPQPADFVPALVQPYEEKTIAVSAADAVHKPDEQGQALPVPQEADPAPETETPHASPYTNSPAKTSDPDKAAQEHPAGQTPAVESGPGSVARPLLSVVGVSRDQRILKPGSGLWWPPVRNRPVRMLPSSWDCPNERDGPG